MTATNWLMTLAAFVWMPEIVHTQPALEIGYDKLDPKFHRSRSYIYGESDLRLILGCLLPPSITNEERNRERHRLKWRKDGNLEICGNKQLPLACHWEDTMFQRGAMVLNVQLEAHDDPSNAFLGSGTYTCYYHDDAKNVSSSETSIRVWVAGKYLEMKVNGGWNQNRSYQLPTNTVSDNDKSYRIECIIGAGLRNVPKDVKVKWFKDGQVITASSKYGFDETGRKLEIFQANGGDEGVYICEAEVNSRIHGGKTRQYVILNGEDVSSASSISGHVIRWSFVLCTAVAAIQRLIGR